MSGMRPLSKQRGYINALVVPLVLFIVLFVAVAGFAAWAFSQRTYYKDNSDKEAAVAADKATKATLAAEAAKYAEEIKKPYETYVGPSAFGNVSITYPKTWSAYVIVNERGSTPITGYFHPKIVPNVGNSANAFALRVELVQNTYDSVLSQYKSYVQSQKATMQPYALPQVPSVVGARVEGQIASGHQGVIVILPLRNLTLKVWTESNDFKADFDTHVLPNLTFVP